MSPTESKWTTVFSGCWAFASVGLFYLYYEPALRPLRNGANIRPMAPVPLFLMACGIMGWLLCVIIGIRQLAVRPRYFGIISIAFGVVQWELFRYVR